MTEKPMLASWICHLLIGQCWPFNLSELVSSSVSFRNNTVLIKGYVCVCVNVCELSSIKFIMNFVRCTLTTSTHYTWLLYLVWQEVILLLILLSRHTQVCVPTCRGYVCSWEFNFFRKRTLKHYFLVVKNIWSRLSGFFKIWLSLPLLSM